MPPTNLVSLNRIQTPDRADYHFDWGENQKLDEVPDDFIRKRLSIVFANDNQRFIVTKGALREVLAVCVTAEIAAGNTVRSR